MPGRSVFDVKQQCPKILPNSRYIYVVLNLRTDLGNRLWPELNDIVTSSQGPATAIPSPDPTALSHCRTSRQTISSDGVKRVLGCLRDTLDDPILRPDG